MNSATNILIGIAVMLAGCSQAQNSPTNPIDVTKTTESVSDSSKSTSTNQFIMQDSNNWNKLTPEEEKVIVFKGTEAPNKGVYTDNHAEGRYFCRRCNASLFDSDSKFDSGSGWPAFDEFIKGSVQEIPDNDGYRVEIVCNNCKGHLGHVFRGERYTKNNTRHCVNSISLNFIPDEQLAEMVKTDTAIFASGCFWGTEYFFEKAPGVISTQVGYIGGHKDNPTYKEVCAHTTGHAEAVMVVFDPTQTTYEALCKLFFETHDPSQVNRQGPDIGDQYRTEVFYMNDEQKETTEKLIALLEANGIKVATRVTKATKFWEGEDYHEHYYSGNGGTPYCHGYTKRFK